MTVNALRKSSAEEEVITLAKSLIKTWKKLLDTGEKKKVASSESSSAKEERKLEEKRDKARKEDRGSFTGDEVRIIGCSMLHIGSPPDWMVWSLCHLTIRASMATR